MSQLPYHKRYHGDALTGFMALTLEERGAYQTLLDMMYDRGGPLIDNERLLAGYMNCSIRKWRQVRESLISKHKISLNSDGQIINSRARKEIENQSKTSRKLIEAGSKGGRARVENEKKPNEINGTTQASLEPRLSQPQAIRATTRSQKPEKKKTEPKGSPKISLPDDWNPEPFGEGALSRRIVDSWSETEAERQVERFKAHHRSAGTKWVDWQSAWSKWVLNSERFAQERRSTNGGGDYDMIDRVLEEAERRKKISTG